MYLKETKGVFFQSCMFFLSCVDDVSKVSSLMANWLKNASTFSAPNPYQRQLLRGGKTRGVRMIFRLFFLCL